MDFHFNVLVQSAVGGSRSKEFCQHQFVVHSLTGGDFHAVEVNGIPGSCHGSLEDD